VRACFHRPVKSTFISVDRLASQGCMRKTEGSCHRQCRQTYGDHKPPAEGSRRMRPASRRRGRRGRRWLMLRQRARARQSQFAPRPRYCRQRAFKLARPASGISRGTLDVAAMAAPRSLSAPGAGRDPPLLCDRASGAKPRPGRIATCGRRLAMAHRPAEDLCHNPSPSARLADAVIVGAATVRPGRSAPHRAALPRRAAGGAWCSTPTSRWAADRQIFRDAATPTPGAGGGGSRRHRRQHRRGGDRPGAAGGRAPGAGRAIPRGAGAAAASTGSSSRAAASPSRASSPPGVLDRLQIAGIAPVILGSGRPGPAARGDRAISAGALRPRMRRFALGRRHALRVASSMTEARMTRRARAVSGVTGPGRGELARERGCRRRAPGEAVVRAPSPSGIQPRQREPRLSGAACHQANISACAARSRPAISRRR